MEGHEMNDSLLDFVSLFGILLSAFLFLVSSNEYSTIAAFVAAVFFTFLSVSSGV